MNRKNTSKRLFLTIFIFATIFLCTWAVSISLDNNFNSNYEHEITFYNNQDPLDLKSSDIGDVLSYSSMHQNATTAYRLFESIQFNINASSFTNPNYTLMQIHYSNDKIENFNMDYVSGTDTNFTYTYTPRYYDPLGFQNVSFLIYNISDFLLSSSNPITNFTITTNYLLLLDSTEYNKGDKLYAELIVNDEPQPYDFDWNVTIVDSDNETIQNSIFDVGNNLMQFSFILDEKFNYTNDFYYIKINMTDSSRNTNAAAYYPFKVLNTLPEIDVSSIKFSVSGLKRAEDCTLTMNANDSDNYTLPENLTATVVIQTSTGFLEDPIELTNHNNWTFSTVFSIGITKPIGLYQFHIEVEDQYGGKDNVTKSLTIDNNSPEIEGYFVNGLSMNQSVSVNYGEDLVFTFDVSDIENTIDYITVSLLDADNNWYEISRKYQPGMKITIRTEDLITGVWYVYISVTDVDQATTDLTSGYNLAPQEINIIPDLITPVLPWISFSIGLLIGLLAGVGILYKKFKTKYVEPKETTLKKSVSKKPPKAKKTVPSKPKVEIKEAKGDTLKESEEISKEPQRKIKRKLK